MKAAVFHGPGDLRVEEVPDVAVAPDGIVIAVRACGICGSDLKTLRTGRLARSGQVLGHEFVGEIIDIGHEVDDLSIGDVVTALPYVPCRRCDRCREGRTSLCDTAFRRSIANGLPGGFAEFLALPGARRGETVFPLPASITPQAGALIEPLAVGLHAVDLAGVRPHDVVVVLGLGTIGLSAVLALKARGVREVVAVDTSALRREAAQQLGAVVVEDATTELLDTMRHLTGPGSYGAVSAGDVVIDCAGSSALLATAMRTLRTGGTLVLAALYDGAVELDVTSVVRRGIRIVGTFAYDGNFARAVELVSSGTIQLDHLVSHRFGLDDIASAFAVQADASRSVKVVVEPGWPQ